MQTPEYVMVTGGAGMIGSNLVKRLVKTGCRVSVVDNLWRGKKEYLLDDGGKPVIDMDRDFHETDLSIPGAVDPLLEGVDYVIHLADIVAGIGYVFNNQGSLFRGFNSHDPTCQLHCSTPVYIRLGDENTKFFHLDFLRRIVGKEWC